MTDRFAIVYCATNLVNGKRYVGLSTKTLAARIAQHERDARRKSSIHFRLAIRKYGIALFRFSIVKRCASKAEAVAEEIRLISLWAPEYNKTSGGEGSSGYVFTLAARKTVSDRLRAAWNGPNAKRLKTRVVCLSDGILFESIKAAAAYYGVSPSCICMAVKGRTALCKGRIFSELNGPKTHVDLNMLVEEITAERERNQETRRRRVICLSDGRRFNSMAEAGRAYGTGHQAIERVARGERKTFRGMRFAFAED